MDQPNPKAIYWLDLETTGLDPHDDKILELAMWRAPFEQPLHAKEIFNRVFRFSDWSDVDASVIDMHYKSGLMIECIRSEYIISQGQADLLKILHEYQDDWLVRDPDFGSGLVMRPAKSSNELPVLAGSSVDFDRSFLRSDMPIAAKRFSHRVYDISSIKLLCRSIGMPPQPKNEAHRSREDIAESIEHTRECFVWLRDHCVDVALRDHKIVEPTAIPF